MKTCRRGHTHDAKQCPTCKKASTAAWQKAHPERMRAHNRASYYRHHEARKARLREWQRTSPNARIHSDRRRARKHGAYVEDVSRFRHRPHTWSATNEKGAS